MKHPHVRGNAAAPRSRRTYRSTNSSAHLSPPAQTQEAAAGISAGDLVYMYLREISQTPLLSQREEVELAKTIRRGSQAEQRLHGNGHNLKLKFDLEERIRKGNAARRQLLKANLRLVVNFAKRYLGHGLTLLDLVQEGNIGLMRAVDKFDHRRGHKFSTLATWWIRQGITRAISTHGASPRLPAHTGQSLRSLDRISHRLTQELCRAPSEAELAAQMRVPVTKVRRWLAASAGTLSLEMQVGDDQEALLADFIEDNQTPPPWAMAVESAMRQDMREALEALTPREARVITLRFGLRDGCDQTLEQVGAKFGLTRERVRQIEQHALTKLRTASRAERLAGYLNSNPPV